MSAPAATTPIDLVDELDRPIGTVPRAAALHARGGFRTVHVFLFNTSGELLLQQLAPSRERHPGRWGSSVAAYLHAGETYIQAAERRVREELGVAIPLRLVGKTRMPDGEAMKFVELYEGQRNAAQVAEREHIAALAYWPLDDLDRTVATQPDVFTPTFVHLFQWFRRGQN